MLVEVTFKDRCHLWGVQGQHLWDLASQSSAYEHDCALLPLLDAYVCPEDGCLYACLVDTRKHLLVFSQSERLTKLPRPRSFTLPKAATAVQFVRPAAMSLPNRLPADTCLVSDKFGNVLVFPPVPALLRHVHLEDPMRATIEKEPKRPRTDESTGPVDRRKSGNDIEDKDANQQDKSHEEEDGIDDNDDDDTRPIIMGHVSMVTCLAVVHADERTSFIVTGDRDEKVRVTHLLEPCRISHFLFAHGAALTCLKATVHHASSGEAKQSLLFSADYAGRLCVHEWAPLTGAFRLLMMRELGRPIRALETCRVPLSSSSSLILRVAYFSTQGDGDCVVEGGGALEDWSIDCLSNSMHLFQVYGQFSGLAVQALHGPYVALADGRVLNVDAQLAPNAATLVGRFPGPLRADLGIPYCKHLSRPS
jgi:hypothetical protein